MKISCLLAPDYPLQYCIETIELADTLGFHGVYSADEIYHKDMYVLSGAAAGRTKNIWFGPCVAPSALREPTQLCQAIATLDELSNGCVECVIAIGNFLMLGQCGIEWNRIKPLSRVKEAHKVMRTLLDEGTISYQGDFFRYQGLFTLARPVQKHVPF
jgi:5,10-methylenetetrahydromethanopterin reductase